MYKQQPFVEGNSTRLLLTTVTVWACVPILAMEYDSADILGHKDSLVPPVATANGFAFSLTQSAGILALLVLAYSLGMRVWQSVLQWREKSHKL